MNRFDYDRPYQQRQLPPRPLPFGKQVSKRDEWWLMVAVVAGAAVIGFVVWPALRPMFVYAVGRQEYAGPQQQVPPMGAPPSRRAAR